MLKSLFLYSLLQQGPFLLRSDSDPEEKNVRLRPDPDPQYYCNADSKTKFFS